MAIATVQFYLNGTWYALTSNGDGTYSATLTAPGATSYNQTGGYYACQAKATNTAGTVTTADTSDGTVGSSLKLVVKERVAPVITMLSPSSGAYVGSNKQPVVFTVIDEAGGSGVDISTLAVKVDGTAVSSGIVTTAVTNGYSVTYTPPSALSDGSHTVTADCKDHDGNAAAQGSVTYTVDTVPPTLNITAPTAGMITNQTSVAYAGTTNDSTSSPVTVTVTLDGTAQSSPTVAANGSFSGSFTGLSDGSHSAVFTAEDGAGKSTTVTRAFTVDTSAPSITAVSIAPNPADAGATMIVTVSVS